MGDISWVEFGSAGIKCSVLLMARSEQVFHCKVRLRQGGLDSIMSFVCGCNSGME
jgi:hypothetical protein